MTMIARHYQRQSIVCQDISSQRGPAVEKGLFLKGAKCVESSMRILKRRALRRPIINYTPCEQTCRNSYVATRISAFDRNSSFSWTYSLYHRHLFYPQTRHVSLILRLAAFQSKLRRRNVLREFGRRNSRAAPIGPYLR